MSDIYIKRWQWYEEMGVRLEVGRRVDRIFPKRKLLVTKEGDVFKILDLARVSKRAAVIGGGLLGLEVAKALKDTLMEQQLDRTASELLKKDLEEMGIHVLLERDTREILGDRKAEGVRFSDGDELSADFVVIATGIKPNADVGINSGLRVNKGIVVDDYMETSASDVYAVGECVEHRGKTFGLVAPIMEQVRVCAHNLIHGNGEEVRRIRHVRHA